MPVDPSPANGFTRVLQGQDIPTFRGTFAESNESDSSEKPLLWKSSLDDMKINVPATKRYESDHWLPLGRPEPSFTDLLSGFGSKINTACDSSMPLGDQAIYKRQTQEHEAKFSLMGNIWSLKPPGLSLNIMDSGMQGSDNSYQARGDVRYGSFGGFSMAPDLRGDNQQANWLMPPPLSTYLQPSQSRELMPKSVLAQRLESMKPKEGNCKLFGIPLVSSSAPSEPTFSHRNVMIEPSSCMQNAVHSHQYPAIDFDQRSDLSKGSNVADHGVAPSEQENHSQIFPSAVDRENKCHSGSTRSCTKVLLSGTLLSFLSSQSYYYHFSFSDKISQFQVHKQGSALGRSVDLAKFNNYDELISELDSLFEFSGDLKARDKNWLVVYTDDEDDMMLVGDDPWE